MNMITDVLTLIQKNPDNVAIILLLLFSAIGYNIIKNLFNVATRTSEDVARGDKLLDKILTRNDEERKKFGEYQDAHIRELTKLVDTQNALLATIDKLVSLQEETGKVLGRIDQTALRLDTMSLTQRTISQEQIDRMTAVESKIDVISKILFKLYKQKEL